MMKLDSYTLHKENPKRFESRGKRLEFYGHQNFFHGKSANFAISRNTDIDCILKHNF